MENKFLPIGSVVLLNEGTKKLMINGFCTVVPEKGYFDYSACLYPEGVISSEQTFVFNHDQINDIFFIGHKDDEQDKFNKNLEIVVKSYQEQANLIAIDSEPAIDHL